jgi:Predicted membrane protein
MSLALSIGFSAFAHDESHHKKSGPEQDVKSIVIKDTSDVPHGNEVMAKPTEFVTLHPLIVHFPIVLLLVAAFLQILGLFYSKNNFDFITLIMLSGGVLGAYLASSFFHAHAVGLTSDAAEILKRHELFASMTLLSSLAALFTKLTGMLVLKKKKLIIEILTTFILIFSAVSVSITGHWGAYLTHIEGVGPQGKYLEKE